MSEAPEVNPAPAKAQEVHPLDALTGGAFSAPTSGERSSRIREWLAGNPAESQLQEVFKELSVKDKGAARPLREKLDELCRAKTQDALAADWATRGQVLLDGQDASDTHVRERQVGFVFQHYALFRHMTVFENVAFGLRVKDRKSVV